MADETPKVYDIRHVHLYVDGKLITGFSNDGFGITPTGEVEIVEGLVSPVGFSLDPSTAAEAMLSLQTMSDSIKYLQNIYRLQMEESSVFTPFKWEIRVDLQYREAIGFKKRGMEYAMLQKAPEWKTDEKKAPAVEFNFIGYGYYEE